MLRPAPFRRSGPRGMGWSGRLAQASVATNRFGTAASIPLNLGNAQGSLRTLGSSARQAGPNRPRLSGGGE